MSTIENSNSLGADQMIAIIGMACRFPGADNVEEFWRNLSQGIESRTSFSDEELLAAGVPQEMLDNQNYVKAGMVLSDIAGFDADFFGITPKEAELLDPQHRLMLECAWTALEHAGYAGETAHCSIGVYVGAGSNSYFLNNLLSIERTLTADRFQMMIGNEKDFLATRISYKLNLKGPSINVLTACSTSLVAVHQACQSLLSGECDLALAGGVSLHVPHRAGYLYQEGMIHSPDGHCRAFDADAQGTIGGSGVGVVALKRLDEALQDGDTIHAVIRGSAVNNDGSYKVGYTAPSVLGQVGVIEQAQAVAGVTADTISYIEAHGTGTSLGDPIEITALTQAFRASTLKNNYCAIGSVKTNIGHADAAAGVAGLIKTVLALKAKQIPATLHFKKPNPKIDFAHSPFYVNTELKPWIPSSIPRRAGVSSFGIGGTNAHVILEEASPPSVSCIKRSCHVLPLSAKTPAALEAAIQQLADHLDTHADHTVADVAYTLSTGRKAFEYRQMIMVGDSVPEAVRALRALEPSRSRITQIRPAAFLFPGTGSQYVNMGLELYQEEPIFREQIDQCCEILKRHLDCDLRKLIYPHLFTDAEPQLNSTIYAQPAVFVIEYALARLWMAWGVQPQAMIGHSLGEYVAACLAGTFSLEEALAVVAARAKLIHRLPNGAMLAVPLEEKELTDLLNDQLSLAAVNGPYSCVVSGTLSAIQDFQKKLAAKGIENKPLNTSHAFHSHMLDPILEQFTEVVRNVSLHTPQIPWISNVTGTWITSRQATDPEYWTQHLHKTVRFADGIQQLLQEGKYLLIEAGPGKTLTSFAKYHTAARLDQVILTSLRHANEERSDVAFLLESVGKFWLAGSNLDWGALYSKDKGRHLPLPTYPFQHQRYWIDPYPNDRRRDAPLPARSAMVSCPNDRPASSPAYTPQQDALSGTERDPISSSGERHVQYYPRPALTAPFAAPQTSLHKTLAKIWQEFLKIEPIGIYDNFFDLGGESLLALQLITKLRTVIKSDTLNSHSLLKAPTIAELSVLLDSAPTNIEEGTLPKELVEIRKGDKNKTPLFLIHPVGGHVYFYYQLANHLSADQPIYGIQATGMENEVENMAACYVAAVRMHQPHGPYCLGGSSFGGMVAFEMAQQLHAAGEEVAMLVMVDTPGPGYLPAKPLETDTEILAYMLGAGEDTVNVANQLSTLDPDTQLNFFLKNSKVATDLFPDIRHARHFLQLFKSNQKAMFRYQPKPWSGNILYFVAKEQHAITAKTPHRAWVSLAAKGVDVVEVEGDHITMNLSPNVQTIAICLQNRLDDLSVKTSGNITAEKTMLLP